MKYTTIGVLAALMLAVTTGFVSTQQGGTANRLQHKVKDLPDEGLTLIDPVHQDFDKELSKILKSKKVESPAAADGIRPFSVLLKNNSKRDGIAYNLKWEITNGDGSVSTQYDQYLEPSVLMGEIKRSNDGSEPAGGVAIRANQVRLLTWADIGDGLIAEDTASAGVMDQPRQGSAGGEDGELLESLHASLGHATGLTVTLDCAVFEDGTAVGPDAAGFFMKFKAQVDAKRDLLLMIQHSYAAGQSPEAILNAVKSFADSTVGARLSDDSPTSHYNFYRRLFAQEILSIRANAVRDDRQAVLLAIQPLRKQWPSIKKKQSKL